MAAGAGRISAAANASKQEPIELRGSDSFMFASLAQDKNCDCAQRTVLPSMPPSLMLPGPKLLKTVIVEAYVTLLDAHESSAATRSSFVAFYTFRLVQLRFQSSPERTARSHHSSRLIGRIFWTTDGYGPEKQALRSAR